MNFETFRSFCLNKKGVTESFPFDESTLVLKVLDKMFALTSLDKEFSINIKCNPTEAVLLREKYNEVKPGFHMNKKHWNTITPNNNIPDKLLELWITNSYELVIVKMTKKNKDILNQL